MKTGVTTSRGIWGYAYGALGGIVSALALSFALTHAGSALLIAAYLISIPLFMSGFGAGIVPGFIASLAGAVGLFATSPAVFGASYLFIEAMPAAGLIWLAMRQNTLPGGKIMWGSEGTVLAALVTYPCLIFLVIYSLTEGHNGGLLAITSDALAPIHDQLTAMLTADGFTVTPDVTSMLARSLDIIAHIMPALMMAVWVFTTLLAMVFAQGILSKQGWSLRPNFALSELTVPTWMIYLVAMTGAVGSFAPAPYDYLGLNLALVVGLPFFFVGLAVVHAAAAQTKSPTLVLFVFYIFIAFLAYLVLLVALLGVVDQWVDFRKRIAAGINNQGRKS